jgi:protein MpaA
VLPLALPPPATPVPARVVAGLSVEGRRIVARRRGDADAPLVVLAVGPIHGDEPGGRAPIRALRAIALPRALQLWTLALPNPDGLARHTRQNARGVDLNRNFPERWRPSGQRGDRYWPGPAPSSEPETRAIERLVCRIEPDLTVYYHQPYGIVVRDRRGDPRVLRAYARVAGLPIRRLPYYRGTATSWQNAAQTGSAMVVELPAGPVADSTARRHARAVLAAAGKVAHTTANRMLGCGH